VSHFPFSVGMQGLPTHWGLRQGTEGFYPFRNFPNRDSRQ